jgi:hypothetical protein
MIFQAFALILRSIVIDHLLPQTNNLNRNKTGVLHFYFQYNDRSNQNAEHFFRSLLKQLLHHLDDVPPSVEQAYNQSINMGTEPKFGELLRDCVFEFSLVFILIDALDECDEDSRLKILQKLQLISSSRLRLFITGRNHVFQCRDIREDDVIQKWLQEAHTQEIKATPEDIKGYVRQELEKKAKSLKPELKTDIANAIEQGVKEQYDYLLMFINLSRFLLAEFQLNYLLGFLSQPRKLVGALKNLPTKIETAYGNVIERIETGKLADKDLALRTLSWIFHTADAGPLKMEELCDLLVTDEDDSDIHSEWRPSPEDIIAVCQSLVICEKDGGVVRFTHFTVQEFLREYSGLHAISEMASICLAYLSFTVFESLCKTRSAFKLRLDKYKASCYVALHWGFYARAADNVQRVRETVTKHFASVSKRRSMLEMIAYVKDRWKESIEFPTGQTLLHIAAENGLTAVCSEILNDNWNKGEGYNDYCIWR